MKRNNNNTQSIEAATTSNVIAVPGLEIVTVKDSLEGLLDGSLGTNVVATTTPPEPTEDRSMSKQISSPNCK